MVGKKKARGMWWVMPRAKRKVGWTFRPTDLRKSPRPLQEPRTEVDQYRASVLVLSR